MPLLDNSSLVLDAQDNFMGGMNAMGDAVGNQYALLRNGEIRETVATTRGGIRRAFPYNSGGVTIGFYFNEENAKYNDATHDGFWFPFDFVKTVFTGNVQGAAYVKHSDWDRFKYLMVVDQVVYTIEEGVTEAIPTIEILDEDEEVCLVQAANEVFMFRGTGKDTLVWDFSSAGFVLEDDPDISDEGPPVLYWDPMPQARGAVYALGRLWAWINDDEMVASDALAFNNWDLALRRYAINYGDGDQIQGALSFDQGILVVFKTRSTHALSGIDGDDIENTVVKATASLQRGALGPRAFCKVGKSIWHLSSGGVYVTSRNEYGLLESSDTPISAPVQPYIDRINWSYAHTACLHTWNGYVLIAVPIDNSQVPNVVLVFDTLIKTEDNPVGVWVGVWDSPVMNPTHWFTDYEQLRFVDATSVVRTLATGDYDDSQDPLYDFPEYDEDIEHFPGEYRTYEVAGTLTLFRCLENTWTWTANSPTPTVHAPGDTDYWEEVTDVMDAVQIQFEFISRKFRHEDKISDKARGRTEIEFQHQNPSLRFFVRTPDAFDEQEIFSTPLTYDRTKYDIADTDDWVESNVNLDYDDPHRRDYTLLLSETGIYIDDDGFHLNTWEGHSARFLVSTMNRRATQYRITNTYGRVRLCSIALVGQVQRFSSGKR